MGERKLGRTQEEESDNEKREGRTERQLKKRAIEQKGKRAKEPERRSGRGEQTDRQTFWLKDTLSFPVP